MCNLSIQLTGDRHVVKHNADIECGVYKRGRRPKAMLEMARHGVLQFALALGAVAIACAMDEEMAELAKMVHDSCADETGADMSLVDKVNGGADLADVPDGKLKCYIQCIMQTAGMMTDGEVDVEAVLAMLPDELRQKNEADLRACGTQRGADHCDNAFLTHVCWQKANKADYFLI